MNIIVDKLPDCCDKCFYYKGGQCFLIEKPNEEHQYFKHNDCPLIELNNNVNIEFEEVDNFGFWKRKYKMYLYGEVISEWEESIEGRHSSWND